jgi:hypothetical protein
MTTNFVNPELATGMTATPIPPSDQEQAAVNELKSRFARDYSPDQVAVRVAAIERDAAERRAMQNPSVKTFKPEVIERLIRKMEEGSSRFTGNHCPDRRDLPSTRRQTIEAG